MFQHSQRFLPFRILLLALAFFPTQAAFPQGREVDSLRSVLGRENLPDSSRFKALNALARSYMYSEPDSTLVLGRKFLALAQAAGDRYQEGQALNTMGIALWVQSDFDGALEYFSASLAIREEIRDEAGVAGSLANIGLIHKQRGDYPRALEYQLKGLALDEARGYRSGVARSLTNIGNIHISMQEYARALEYHQRALAISEEEADSASLARALGNVGLVYQNLGDDDAALRYQERSLRIRELIGDKRGEAIALYNVGLVLKNKGELAAALDHQLRALALEEELGNRQGIAQSHVEIAEVHLAMGRSALALVSAAKAATIAEAIGDPETLKGAELIAYRVHRKAGREGKALQHYERYIQLRDSIMGEENQQEVARQETRFEYEKRMLADSLSFATEQAVKDLHIAEQRASISKQRLGLAGVGVGLLLITALAISIRRGKKRSDELLLNILPEETARELKAKGKAEARLYDQVTVLFTDFKGFTELSAILPPRELVAMIDECFSAFDDIVGRYGVEKIKTIGDAYMAVGGLPTANNTHARDVVSAALDIRQWMAGFQERRAAKGLPAPGVRLGVHSGPVVAGIVGSRKFQYDIWGDTVNTASRMESHGEISQVNVSAATRSLLGDAFVCRSRGRLPVKGKGELDMFIVERPA